MGVTKIKMGSTTGEQVESKLLMHGNHGSLMEPRIHFRSFPGLAANPSAPRTDYFGDDMVKASTIWVKRYWYSASVLSMSASVFCKVAWLNSTMELSPKL